MQKPALQNNGTGKAHTELTKEEIERELLNERLVRVRDVLKKRGEKLSEEEYQAVKIIFHDAPQLDFVPKSLWIPLAQMLTLREVFRGEKFIAREDLQPPCCIVLSGKFQAIPHGDGDSARENILLPGSACGNFQFFNNKHWKPVDVFGMDEVSTVAVFETQGLAKLLAIENSNIQFKSLLSFLTESIPKFDQLSGHLKERLCRFFKEVIFLPGKEIIQEGSTPSSAYLIKEGTCTIMSRQNPLFHPSMQKYIKVPPDPTNVTSSNHYSVHRTVNTVLSPAKTLRGYMSLSTNIYQLRTVGEKEWFGEETLIVEELSNFKYEYSVIARTKLVALEITRENLKKFPRDLLDWFKRNAYNKTTWHNERKAELAESIGKIYHMDPLTNFLGEALVQVTRKFPQASPRLTTQLHKHNFLSQDDVEEEEVPKQKLVRPKSGVMPTFNNLRLLMSTKKQATTASSMQRPLTATQPIPKFEGRSAPGTAGYRSAANFVHTAQNRKFSQTAGTPFRFYGTPSHPVASQNKIYLEAASTFRMSYKNKASIPTVPRKHHVTKRIVVNTREKPEDSKVEKMKLQIETLHDTFKVGLRDVKVIEPDSAKRPPSPNPAKAWASKHNVNFAKWNEEIKAKMQPVYP